MKQIGKKHNRPKTSDLVIGREGLWECDYEARTCIVGEGTETDITGVSTTARLQLWFGMKYEGLPRE